MSAPLPFVDGPLTMEEMYKIVTLLENPPEAALLRRSLMFYEPPEHLRVPANFKWGENRNLIAAMNHFLLPQDPHELDWMLSHIRGKTSLLEIGSSFGGTLKRMASVMPKGSRIVSVDLPCDETPKFLNPGPTLKDTCRKIGSLGADVQLFVGDSHAAEVVEAVRTLGPYEFGFIDGDHSYDGIWADWENYGPMCKTVGFHDIGGGIEDCARFWREIKADKRYRTDERISRPGIFGIGIIYRE